MANGNVNVPFNPMQFMPQIPQAAGPQISPFPMPLPNMQAPMLPNLGALIQPQAQPQPPGPDLLALLRQGQQQISAARQASIAAPRTAPTPGQRPRTEILPEFLKPTKEPTKEPTKDGGANGDRTPDGFRSRRDDPATKRFFEERQKAKK